MARLGSPVLASIPDASGACTGCDLKGLGSLQVIDRSIAAQTCVAGFEVQVTWSLTGPKGVTGPMGAAGPQGPAGPAGAGNVSLASALYGMHPSCSGPGALTLEGACVYVQPAIETYATVNGFVCPADEGASLRIIATDTTPTTCAAQCAGALTQRSDCAKYTDVCHGPSMNFYGPCIYQAPTRVTTTTVCDLTCTCDITLLGHLVR